MATSTKTKKAPPKPPVPPKPEEAALAAIERKRQIRLGVGIFFLLAGVYTCFSIISYYFSWTADQDKFFTSHGMWGFVFNHESVPVANWGGRFGAALSHILVYKGAGVASLVVGMAIGAVGLHIVYGSRVLPVLRYLRWVSILLLVVAPILTYLFPGSSFPLGGRLGIATIDYLNGFLGMLGTGMVLLSTVLFFVFVIFALDIRPFINKMRQRAKNVATSLAPMPAFNEPVAAAERNEPIDEGQAEAEVVAEEEQPATAEEIEAEKQWEITVREEEDDAAGDAADEEDTPEEETEEHLEYQV